MEKQVLSQRFMKITGIDYVVFTVKDINRTCEFYSRVLGMQESSPGNGKKALLFGSQKINLHEAGKEFEPKAGNPCSQFSGRLPFNRYSPVWRY